MERTLTGGFGGTFSASAEIGRALFVAMLILLTLIVLVLAPASTAGAISLEREKQTLDLLITTPISSLAIVLGKLLSALSWILLLLLASIPVDGARVHVRRRRARRHGQGLRRAARARRCSTARSACSCPRS